MEGEGLLWRSSPSCVTAPGWLWRARGEGSDATEGAKCTVPTREEGRRPGCGLLPSSLLLSMLGELECCNRWLESELRSALSGATAAVAVAAAVAVVRANNDVRSGGEVPMSVAAAGADTVTNAALARSGHAAVGSPVTGSVSLLGGDPSCGLLPCWEEGGVGMNVGGAGELAARVASMRGLCT